MNMKKIVTLVMALVLLLGCGAEAAVSSNSNSNSNTASGSYASEKNNKQDKANDSTTLIYSI